ncbi:MAG: SAM-dependent chlorinase/fluorinase [Actinobacteria bacterium]|nr:SAM-dependent chlorinase/fluorinase [Actinomycetota bacterium]
MLSHSYITFLSDFGWKGGYVAACEAVVAAITPSTRMLHVSHAVELGDIRGGGLVLARIAPLGPPAVHLVVVDPGVGTRRRAVVVHAARGDYLVGPDNGLMMPALAALGGATAAWHINTPSLRTQAGLSANELSHTFHARDVFAPAAALLATGLAPATFGQPIDPTSLVHAKEPFLETDGETTRAEIIEIDRFGNVSLALELTRSFGEISARLTVFVEGEADQGWACRRVNTFGELRPGELGVLRDSWGHACLVLYGASAAELLGARGGAIMRMVPPADELAAGPTDVPADELAAGPTNGPPDAASSSPTDRTTSGTEGV